MSDLFKRDPDAVNFPPFETEDLRTNLAAYLDTPFDEPNQAPRLVGNFRGASTRSSTTTVSRSTSAKRMSDCAPVSDDT